MGQEDLSDSILTRYISQSGTTRGMAISTSDSQHLIAASLKLVVHGFDRPRTAVFLDESANRDNMVRWSATVV